MTKNILLTALTLLLSVSAFSQETHKKFWVSGTSRGVYNLDEYNGQSDDTTTVKKSEYGHTLVDLSANIKPNKNTFIRTTLRVRNEYGGFWGSGITFDVRELYLKGLIANSVRYQIGDIDYKLTPFTFFNSTEELYENSLDIFNMQKDILHYDYFYTGNNTWRQQGIASDFSLSFREGIEELQFNFFSSRMNLAGSSNDTPYDERLFVGGNMTMVQSENLSAGVNYINLMDVSGTSESKVHYRNPVVTGTYKVNKGFGDLNLELTGESGISKSYMENDNTKPKYEDFFNYAKISTEYKPLDMTFSVAYRNVGPEFRSVGAQSRRISLNGKPFMYERYTNDKSIRPIGIWDIYSDPALYALDDDGNEVISSMHNIGIKDGLAGYYPQYNNIDPYGLATPNRKGFDISLEHIDDQNRYTVNVDYSMLSDIIGQGTDILRDYNSLSAQTEIHVDELLSGISRDVTLELGYTLSETKRTFDDIPEANSNLTSERITAGLTVQVSESLDLLAGYESFVSTGKDEIAIQNEFNEITNYTYEADLSENITGIGLRYTFSDDNDLQLLWQDYNWSNPKYFNLVSEQAEDKPDYSFSRISLAFIMKF